MDSSPVVISRQSLSAARTSITGDGMGRNRSLDVGRRFGNPTMQCMVEVQEASRLGTLLKGLCEEAKHNKEEMREFKAFLDSCPFNRMLDLAVQGNGFKPLAVKMLCEELNSAQPILEKHASRGKMQRLLRGADETKSELNTLRKKISFAFELLDMNLLAQGGMVGEWRGAGASSSFRGVPRAGSTLPAMQRSVTDTEIPAPRLSGLSAPQSRLSGLNRLSAEAGATCSPSAGARDISFDQD